MPDSQEATNPTPTPNCPPTIMNSPVPMMCGGYPSVGGMGPNIVFNFSQPYCYPYTMVPANTDNGEKKEEKKEEKDEPAEAPKPVYVQAKPTFGKPRLVAEIGKERQKDPCLLM